MHMYLHPTMFYCNYCRPSRTCNGFSDCMTSDGWKWIGGGSTGPMNVEPSHQASVSSLAITMPTNCVYLENNQLKDRDCNDPLGGPAHICTIGYGGVGLGASIGNH